MLVVEINPLFNNGANEIMEENLKKITIGEIQEVKREISTLKTIGEWKACVKKFAGKFNLTDKEAIAIVNDRAF